MREPKNYERFIASFLIFSFLCSSCAVYRAGHLSPVSQWPPEPPTKKKSISIVVTAEMVQKEKKGIITSGRMKRWHESTVRAYSESDLFSEVKTGLTETDLRAEVKIIIEYKPNIGLALLSGFTLGLIPYKETNNLIVKTTIKDRDGNTPGIFEKSEDVNSMVFLGPGLIPWLIVYAMVEEYIAETIYDIHRAIINEAYAEGVF